MNDQMWEPTRRERRLAREMRYIPTVANPGVVKPSWLTKEFLTTVIVQVGGVVMIFNRQLGVDLRTKWAAPFAALAMSLAAMAFSFARGNVKVAAYNAVAKIGAAQASAQPAPVTPAPYTIVGSATTAGTPAVTSVQPPIPARG